MPDSPVQTGTVNEDRVCVRCGVLIPANWRHYTPGCLACWPRISKGEEPASDCEECRGTGYGSCRPQDLTYLRVSGTCAVCGKAAFYLTRTVAPVGKVDDSHRHSDARLDEQHVAVAQAGPLSRVLTDFVERTVPKSEDSGGSVD